jgi:hypothetical protein
VVFIDSTLDRARPHDASRAVELRMFGLTGVWIAIAAATCVPIGMFAYRMAVAADMMHAPRIVAGSAPADCSLAMGLKSSDRPDYVQIADAWEWTIQPWSVDRTAPMHRINTTNGAALPLCELRHGTTTRGWAEWVASEAFTKEQCWEAFAPTNRLFAYVLLYPPPLVTAGCHGTGPLAVPLPLSEPMRLMDWATALSRGEWHGAAANGSLTTLRIALGRPVFRTPRWAREMGMAWYNESSESPWFRDRIPLVLPFATDTPEERHRFFVTRMCIMMAVAAALLITSICVSVEIDRRGLCYPASPIPHAEMSG